MNLINRFNKVLESIPLNVKVIAVSKTKPNSDILELYNEGCKIFGENKVQELVSKYETLPKNIEWHFIGHLQSNKVKYIAPFISLIHGVDSFKLLKVIDGEGFKNKRIIDCLLQFHIAEEESKFGLSLSEAEHILQNEDFSNLKNIRIRGVMGMATFTEDQEVIKNEFLTLKEIFTILKGKYFSNQDSFNELSMGMSDDYKLAIEAGSTMVRIGSLIFGERNYSK